MCEMNCEEFEVIGLDAERDSTLSEVERVAAREHENDRERHDPVEPEPGRRPDQSHVRQEDPGAGRGRAPARVTRSDPVVPGAQRADDARCVRAAHRAYKAPATTAALTSVNA